MHDANRYALLHGPYVAPAARRGDKAFCLFRDADVVITGWSSGRIPWLRCRRAGTSGGNGLFVDAELARAVRCESKLAILYWWGVSPDAVHNWRQALGVGTLNEGSSLLRKVFNAELSVRNRGRRQPAKERDRRRQMAHQKGWGRNLRTGAPPEKLWRGEELALLGTMPDADVAARIGRSVTAVRVKRWRLKIAEGQG